MKRAWHTTYRRSGGIHASGLAEGYSAGRRHIAKMSADFVRYQFCDKLALAASKGQITVTETEWSFLSRITTETNTTVPEFHPGDANIADSLKRKYEKALPC